MNTLAAVILIVLAWLPRGTAEHLATKIIGSGNAPVQTAAYTPVSIPEKVGTADEASTVSALSWYAVDVDSGVELGARQPDTERPIASITKLATALVFVHDHAMAQPVTVPTLPAYAPDDEIIGLKAGEQFSAHDLLSALLINSADDSADALALADSGNQTTFVAKMNRLIATWGIKNARFSNPSGLVDSGNGASARAVAQLARLTLHNSALRQLVMTKSVTIRDRAGQSYTLMTTDQLLQSGGFSGIKTGYTEAAGQCFVGLTTIRGHQVITVVLGSQDRFGDTAKLADWISHTYQWQPPR